MLNAADAYVAQDNLDLPQEPDARRFDPVPDCVTNPVLELDLASAGITAIVWATGFAPDFGWLRADTFEAKGTPLHDRGVSRVPGLYFLGLPWLSRRALHLGGLERRRVSGEPDRGVPVRQCGSLARPRIRKTSPAVNLVIKPSLARHISSHNQGKMKILAAPASRATPEHSGGMSVFRRLLRLQLQGVGLTQIAHAAKPKPNHLDATGYAKQKVAHL